MVFRVLFTATASTIAAVDGVLLRVCVCGRLLGIECVIVCRR